MLKVKGVNLHVGANSVAHMTDKFETKEPVLRRGQPFNLSLTLDRPFDQLTDLVRIYFKCLDVEEKSPRQSGGCSVSRAARISTERNVWSLALLSHTANQLHLKVKSPCNLAVARYRLHVDTRTKTAPGVDKYIHQEDIYFVFNPWNKGDEVFMSEKELLDEYVLADVGKVWVGSAAKPRGLRWVFGQFAAPVLPALLRALKNSSLTYLQRGNPVHLVREITRVVCCAGENEEGVLKWPTDKYEHGETCAETTVPWNSSAAILKQYLDSDGAPVPSAHCWVFSAVVTAVCRAVGIPCRSVTVYNAARDADASLCLDLFPADSEKESETLWEFHVWNDVWMARPDLPQGYGGWQIIDATPQQQDFDESYSTGPSSVVAVRRGETNHIHDTERIVGTINADLVSWTMDPDMDEWKPTSIDKHKVGRLVLTKAPHVYDPHGDADFLDITDLYKNPEGSKEERLAFFNALRRTFCAMEVYPTAEISFVEFDLLDIESVDLGQDIPLQLNIKNGSMDEKTVDVSLIVCSLHYNGTSGHVIRSVTQTVKLTSHNTEVLKVGIAAEEYGPKLVELGFVKVSALCRVHEENYVWTSEDHFVINLPELIIQSKGDLKKKKEGKLVFCLRNPLKCKLTGCKIVFEAPGIDHNITVPCRDVNAIEEMRMETAVVPEDVGTHLLTAIFDSAQLRSIRGSASIRVTP